MTGHRALDNEIAEVEVAEVVTTVAQGERLELFNAGLLVGEEFKLILLVIRVEALVGIEHHRLQCVLTRLSSLNARFAKLVELAFLTFFWEELYVDRATPVVGLLVLLAVVIGN